MAKAKRKRVAKENRKNLRLWAEGAREEVLTPHIEPYADALSRGWRQERGYVKKVCNEFHARIDWRLPDWTEPEMPLPSFNPDVRLPSETLTPEEKETKRCRLDVLDERIRRWLKYRARKLRKQFRTKSNPLKDPWALLLAKLAGVVVPHKARQAYQQFMKDEYDQAIAPEVASRWATAQSKGSSVQTVKEPDAAFRAAVARDLFAKLPKDRQQHFAQRAKTLAAQDKALYEKTMKNPPDQSPEAKQRCIDNIGTFVGPILQGIFERTGLHSVLILGGPIPKFGGALRTHHIAYGRNKTAGGNHLPQRAKDRFNSVLDLVREYLETAFAAASLDAAPAPAPASGASTSTPTLASGVVTSAAASLPSAAAASLPSAAAAAPPSDPPAPLDPAAAARAKLAELREEIIAEQRSWRNEVEAEKEKKKRGRKRPEPASGGDALQPTRKSRRLNGEPRVDGGFGAPEQHASQESTAPTGDGSTPVTAAPPAARLEHTGATSVADAAPKTPAVFGARPEDTSPANATGAVEPPAPPVGGAVSSATAPKGVAALRIPTTASPTPSSTPDAGALPSTFEMPDGLPLWLRDGLADLTRDELGGSYKALLAALIQLEKAFGFENRANVRLPKQYRPAAVEAWIKGGRGRSKKVPELSVPVERYATDWQQWWDSLQPAWRVKDSQGRWALGDDAGGYGADWASLEFPGVNGCLSIVASLYFWGRAVRNDSQNARSQWEAAVEDVAWMLEGMGRAYLKPRGR
ncbi:hypothetical protein B0H11DRAFT_1731310 [Mycena galericulata]|nr:hypothetical protein B0H11DRAFT_1731310 [Mycena galericulata]